MRPPARRLFSSVVAVIAVLAIAIGVNLFVGARFANAHLDFTAGGLYTLSKGTRTILADLKQPITLRLYYSRRLGARLPLYGEYAERVRAMLGEYAARAHGRIHLEFFDPLPFSQTEDQALGYGLTGVPLEQSGGKVYFGLVGTNLINTERMIPFFDPSRERFLEYDLTRLVLELAHPKPPVMGVMSSLPMFGNPRMMMMGGGRPGQPGGPWMSLVELEKDFHLEQVPLSTQVIDPKIQVLLVVQPQNLSPPTLYAIDQFVMRGGRLMVAVDPRSETEASTPGPNGVPSLDTASDLPRLFKAWGIAYSPQKIVTQENGAIEVQAGNSDEVAGVPYIAWFNIRNGISRADPATADLRQITVASPGFIAKAPGARISVTPLLESSPQSQVLAVRDFSDPNPAKLLAQFRPSGGSRVIAARVRGILHSAFKGPPPLPPGVKRATDLPPYVAVTNKPADLVILADSDILADRFWVQVQNFFGQPEAVPFSDNGAFISNLVGSLTGGDLLLTLRGRGDPNRPFTMIQAMQNEAQARFRRTELALQARLKATEQKLTALRHGTAGASPAAVGAGGQALLTAAQTQAIKAAEQQILTTRQELRQVEFDLNRNITQLETKLLVFCIVLVPLVLVLIAIVLAFYRRHRRRLVRA
ncbi:MAG: GldG family protein [Acetobacteraceae bacterium]